MKHTRVIASLLASSLLAAPASAEQTRKQRRQTAAAANSSRTETAASELKPTAKVIPYTARDVAYINTKLRFTTLIILPTDELILDFVCGDKDFWIVSGEENFAYVKPAKENSQTNLNLITASGNVYSFLLAEVSGRPGIAPDLKVVVELKDSTMSEAKAAPRRFVSSGELEEHRRVAELAKEETRRVKESTQAAIDAGISRFVSNVRFAYRFEAGKKPFYVRAMYHDDSFTYIQARPEETPTLYELKDGKPNLVNFQYKDGVYVVDKILDQGYLVVGKQKLSFRREE